MGWATRESPFRSAGRLAGTTVPTDFFAGMNMQYGTVNLVLQKPDGPVRPYGLVGMGVYYRPIEVTTTSVGYLPGYCDPWWYVCYPGGFVPVENVVGKRSSTDFGMDFGGGVKFGVDLRRNPLSLHLGADRRGDWTGSSPCPASARSERPTASSCRPRLASASRP